MKTTPEWNPQALLGLPCFAPLYPGLRHLPNAAFPTLHDCNEMLASHLPAITVHNGLPVRCVPQEYGKLSFEAQYEPRCYLKGEVPTRENNWHDLLNALVWFSFPKAKAAINVRHFRALTEDDAEGQSQRGVVRDTNTLFDESGVVVACADTELAELLQNFRWKELFWQRRAHVQASMGFYLFGHGLYEKTLHPYIGMTGQGLVLPVVQEFFDWPPEQQLAHLDTLLADYLSAPEHCRSTQELTPVPLLGIPGWAAENEDAAYYDNAAYFRPGRHARKPA